VIFEMPVVVFLLTKLGLLKPAFLKKNRAYTDLNNTANNLPYYNYYR